jgi:hypothetical protein
MTESPLSRIADLRRPVCAHCGVRASGAAVPEEARVEVVVMAATALPVMVCPACRVQGMAGDRVQLCRGCAAGGTGSLPHLGV